MRIGGGLLMALISTACIYVANTFEKHLHREMQLDFIAYRGRIRWFYAITQYPPTPANRDASTVNDFRNIVKKKKIHTLTVCIPII